MSLLEKIHRGKQPMPPRLVLYGTEGIGKAQPLDAGVLTPSGFTRMGDLHTGDEVIGSDGRGHGILAVHPQGKKEVFRVTFRDGSSTCCCDDHLWFTQTAGERERGVDGAVRKLRDIRKTLRYGRQFNHAVPRVESVEFADVSHLPIDPWLMGMYLGDGDSAGNVVITNSEHDIRERIAECLEEGDTCVSNGGIGLRVKTREHSADASSLQTSLRELGLAGLGSAEKFVPAAYLRAGVEQRIAVLRGLLDSDGFVTNPGAVEYTTVSPQLASDFCFLVRSLGGSARRMPPKETWYTRNGQRFPGKPAHRVFASFPGRIVPVSSSKHLAKWDAPEWVIRHTIRDVEPIGSQECQCIRIDSPDQLYVTDDFILTHNSTFAAEAPRPVFIQTEDGLGEIECDKFPLATQFDHVKDAIRDLLSEDHDYQTVVIDSLDWLERQIWDVLCAQFEVTSIEKVDGGYAKGYTHALTYWRQFLDALNLLRAERGMVVICIAHAKVEKFDDPESAAYDRYSPRLNKHASALVCEWSDAVLFATRRFRTQTEDAGFNRKRTIAAAVGAGGGERVLRCVGGPTCIAKNRYGIDEELPLSWPAFMEALSRQPQPTGVSDG